MKMKTTIQTVINKIKDFLNTRRGKIVAIIALAILIILVTIITYAITEGSKKEVEDTKEAAVTIYHNDENDTSDIETSPETSQTESETETETSTQEETTIEEETTTIPVVIPIEDLNVSKGDDVGEDILDNRNEVVEEDEPEETTTQKPTEPSTEIEEETVDKEQHEDNKNWDTPIIAGAEYGAIAKGIDVSKHQGNIDWEKVKAAGYSFAIIRCGYRGYETGALAIDDKFEQNIKGALANNIQVGIYFFSQAITEKEAQEEASLVINLIKEYNITYPVTFDWETAPGRRTYKTFSVSEMTKMASTFLSMVENAGYKGMLYGNKSDLQRFDTTSLSKKYKIWFARYTSTYQYSETYYKAGDVTPELQYPYQMWQYKSTGKVSGISTNVDMNVAFFSYEGSGIPATTMTINLKQNELEIKPNTSIELMDGITAVSSSLNDISSKVTFEILDAKGAIVEKKNAIATKSEYTVRYYVKDFTGVSATKDMKLIVDGSPKIQLNYSKLFFFDSINSNDISDEQYMEAVKNKVSEILQSNMLSALDFEGNDLSSQVIVTNPQEWSLTTLSAGTYGFTYSVKDSYNFEGSALLEVVIINIKNEQLVVNSEEFVADEQNVKQIVMGNLSYENPEGIEIALSDELIADIEAGQVKTDYDYTVKYLMSLLDGTLYYKECKFMVLEETSGETSDETAEMQSTSENETTIDDTIQ